MMSCTISCQISNCFRFMRLFGISFFSIIKAESDCIEAIIAWREDYIDDFPDIEDIQKIRWKCNQDLDIDDALIAGEYAYDTGLIQSDRVIMTEDELINFFNWSEERAAIAINKLMQIRVLMIDNEEETDSFFLHR